MLSGIYCYHKSVQLTWPLVIEVEFVIELYLDFLLGDSELSAVDLNGVLRQNVVN